MSAQLLGLHRPGTTWLHRLPADAKLVGLMVASLVVVLVHGPVSAVAFVLVAAALVAWSGADLGLTLRAMRWLLVTAAVLGPQFPLDLLAAVGQFDEGDLSQLPRLYGGKQRRCGAPLEVQVQIHAGSSKAPVRQDRQRDRGEGNRVRAHGRLRALGL